MWDKSFNMFFQQQSTYQQDQQAENSQVGFAIDCTSSSLAPSFAQPIELRWAVKPANKNSSTSKIAFRATALSIKSVMDVVPASHRIPAPSNSEAMAARARYVKRSSLRRPGTSAEERSSVVLLYLLLYIIMEIYSNPPINHHHCGFSILLILVGPKHGASQKRMAGEMIVEMAVLGVAPCLDVSFQGSTVPGFYSIWITFCNSSIG